MSLTEQCTTPYEVSLSLDPILAANRLIFPDPARGRGLELNPNPTNWLALRRNCTSYDPYELGKVDCTSLIRQDEPALLRALSQTCRSLRAFALSRLWSVAHVDTVEQVGRMRETLRASPCIGPCVRSFRFAWAPAEEWYACKDNAEEKISVADAAFRDTRQMWLDLKHKYGYAEQHVVERTGRTRALIPKAYVMHNGARYLNPAKPPLLDPLNRHLVASYDWTARCGLSGPDGKGEDRLIKSAQQLTDCLTEIVSQLTSLETFVWRTRHYEMPPGVIDALAKLITLKRCEMLAVSLEGDIHLGESGVSVPALEHRSVVLT